MEIANEIFWKTLKIASVINRNYIIDQVKIKNNLFNLNIKCNVLFKSRIEKLKLFENFKTEAIVLVLSDAEQKRRMIKKERYLSKNNFNYPRLCLESFRNMAGLFIL